MISIQNLFPAFFFLTACLCHCKSASAFCGTESLFQKSCPVPHTELSMVGGRGWDNSDYLSGLSGGEEDRKQAQKDYEEFSERRQSFMDRQEEIMETPQGRAYLQQQLEQANMKRGMMKEEQTAVEEVMNTRPGSGGGSRMAQMMVQAKHMQKMKEQMKQMGLEQKLAIPLEDDDEEDA